MKEYRTTDYHLAIVYYTLRKKILRVEPDPINRGRKIFIFLDDGTLQDLYMKFMNREIMVEVKTYIESSQTIKDMIFSSEGR